MFSIYNQQSVFQKLKKTIIWRKDLYISPIDDRKRYHKSLFILQKLHIMKCNNGATTTKTNLADDVVVCDPETLVFQKLKLGFEGWDIVHLKGHRWKPIYCYFNVIETYWDQMRSIALIIVRIITEGSPANLG